MYRRLKPMCFNPGELALLYGNRSLFSVKGIRKMNAFTLKFTKDLYVDERLINDHSLFLFLGVTTRTLDQYHTGESFFVSIILAINYVLKSYLLKILSSKAERNARK